MEVRLTDYITIIKKSDENLYNIMKENFYKNKIQEAKEVKNGYQSLWDKLSVEIEKQILDYKKEIEYGIRYSGSGVGLFPISTTHNYIEYAIKKNRLTIANFKEFMFSSLGIMLPKMLQGDLPRFLYRMINKINLTEKNYVKKFVSNYNLITRNNTPSFKDFIKYVTIQRMKRKNSSECYYKRDDNRLERKHMMNLRMKRANIKKEWIVRAFENTSGKTKNEWTIHKTVDFLYWHGAGGLWCTRLDDGELRAEDMGRVSDSRGERELPPELLHAAALAAEPNIGYLADNQFRSELAALADRDDAAGGVGMINIKIRYTEI
jgi:hypothetical protein